MAFFLIGMAALAIGGLAGVSEVAKVAADNKDLCNPPEGNQWADGIAGAGSGLLNMVGLGFLVDPIAPLQNQLSTAQSKLQGVYNNDGLQFAKNQEKINQFLQEVMETKGEVLQEMLAINTEITNENLGRVDIALASIGILMLIVVIYLLFQPN